MIRGILLALCALTIAAGLALAVLWRQGSFPRWIKDRALHELVARAEPHLPFRVEEINTNLSLPEILAGKLGKLTLTLVWKTAPWRAHFEGPIVVTRWGHDFKINYATRAWIEKIALLPDAANRTEPFDLALGLTVPETFTSEFRIREGELHAGSPTWAWKLFALEAVKPTLDVEWSEGAASARGEVSWSELHYAPLADRRVLNFGAFRASGVIPLTLFPVELGQAFTAQAALKHAEGLWDERYLDLDTEIAPLQARVTLGNTPSVALELGGHRELLLEASFAQIQPHALSWRLSPLKAARLARWLGSLSSSGIEPLLAAKRWVGDIAFRDGTIATRGKARWQGGALAEAEGTASLHALSARWPAQALSVRGVEFELPVKWEAGGLLGTFDIRGAQLSGADLRWRRLRAQLAPVLLRADPGGNLELADAASGALFPLSLSGTRLEIGALRGNLASVSTSFKLSRQPLAPLLGGLCIDAAKFPMADFSADYPKIAVSKDTIDPTGEAVVDLFGGQIKLTNLTLYDYLTAVPETDFDLDWQGVRLDLLGDWLHFGEMDGVIQGYAHDAVFQSWLPTQYDFDLELKPMHRYKVVFSPDAMKNTVRVISGNGVSHLPGVADWLAFGWPSRIFGGYDIMYAGLSLHSSDGLIRLETHDPARSERPDTETDATAVPAGMHFILYGPRFKIPLKSSRYPLMLDAPAMGNFVRQMAAEVRAIGEEKKEKEKRETTHPISEDCIPD